MDAIWTQQNNHVAEGRVRRFVPSAGFVTHLCRLHLRIRGECWSSQGVHGTEVAVGQEVNRRPSLAGGSRSTRISPISPHSFRFAHSFRCLGQAQPSRPCPRLSPLRTRVRFPAAPQKPRSTHIFWCDLCEVLIAPTNPQHRGRQVAGNAHVLRSVSWVRQWLSLKRWLTTPGVGCGHLWLRLSCAYIGI
jgi:hypothetical protein